jgi:hypothetical protein
MKYIISEISPVSCGREMCIDQFNSNERTGLTLFSLGMWKLRDKRRAVEKDPPCVRKK